MTTDTPSSGFDRTEACPECERETHHDVEIEIRTEADKEVNAEFSREPYRVTKCRDCGHEDATRLNNVTRRR